MLLTRRGLKGVLSVLGRFQGTVLGVSKVESRKVYSRSYISSPRMLLDLRGDLPRSTLLPPVVRKVTSMNRARCLETMVAALVVLGSELS